MRMSNIQWLRKWQEGDPDFHCHRSAGNKYSIECAHREHKLSTELASRMEKDGYITWEAHEKYPTVEVPVLTDAAHAVIKDRYRNKELF